MRNTLNRLVLIVGLGLATTVALAQNGDPPREGGRGRGHGQRADGGRPGRGPGPRDGPPDRTLDPFVGPPIVKLLPEDQGPLQPGEEDTLMAFAAERFPRVAAMLERLRVQNPDRFHALLEQHAPRLRQMQRLQQTNPQLANIIQEHAEARFKISQRMRMLRRLPAEGVLAERVWRDVRGLLARTVRIEATALEAQADELAARRDERVAARVAALLDGTLDPAAEPERVRILVQQWQALTDGPEREAARAQLTQAVERQAQSEMDALRARAENLRTHAGEEVDHRIERMQAELQRRGGPHGPRGGPPDSDLDRDDTGTPPDP